MSARYLGGVIAQTQLPLNPAAGNAANGVFTLNQYMQAVKNATWPGFDPYFKQNVLLLHGNGTNGAQNNTFLDSSTNNFTITRNGNTTQGTFSPFSVGAGEWSNFFDGSGDYLSIPDNAAFDFGSGSFTIEAWVYPSDVTPSKAEWIVSQWQSDTQNSWGVRIETNGELRFWYSTAGNTASNIAATTPGINENAWNHIAVVRNGNDLTIYVNGVSKATGSLSGVTLHNSTVSVIVAGQANTGLNQNFTGYVSNLRLVKGTAVYTSNFTPSTTPLTAITNTSLLTCQSNRFVDNSTNAFAITRNGDVRVTPFSPFAPTAAYSAGTNGGSGYFDGNDHLSVAYNAALDITESEFTFEVWLYRTASGTQVEFVNQRASSSGWLCRINTDNTVLFAYAGSGAQQVLSVSTLQNNTWTHLAVTRSGTTMRMFINGIEDVISTTGTDGTPSTADLYISRTYNAASGYFTGYISNLRIIKGTALYTSNFTPPTAPLTAITNTSLLLNFTNAGIFDNTGKNNLETVGNAQIDTTIKRFGDGSLEFDGTGDRLLIPPSADLDLSVGDFTIECWVYTNTIAAGGGNIAYRGVAGNISLATEIQWSIYRSGSSLIVRPYASTTNYTITIGTIAVNTWYHVAFTRSGSTFRGFLNGIASSTTQTIAGALNNSTAWPGAVIGLATIGGADEAFNGYVDDLRITKGVARYTSNFAVPYLPQGPLPLVGGPYIPNTVLMLPGTGTNGAQNNTFLDSSTNNFTITRNGNATQGTFSPFSRANGYWGNYFDGTGDFLSITATSALQLNNTTAFTIEFWVNPANIPSVGGSAFILRAYNMSSPFQGYGIAFGGNTANTNLQLWNGTAWADIGTVSATTWTHVAVTYEGSGSTLRYFINGTQQGSATTVPSTINWTGTGFILGARNNDFLLTGYLSNFRLVKGTAVYTSNFTPTGPLTAIANTSLLTCQSNRFIDNSTNNFTITRNGDVKVVTFSPFEYLTAYSPTTNGGSGYFDGNGDALSAPNDTAFDFSTGDFTVECWVYMFQYNTGQYQPIFQNAFLFYTGNTGGAYIFNGSTDVVSTAIGVVPINTWVHLAFVRSGSGTNNTKIYVNGVQEGQATVTAAIGSGNPNLIGNRQTIWFPGYISNLRVVKGTAVYTSNFTPPTAPVTAIANTSLLLNFTNAGIYDASMTNDLETVGNAQVSTTQSKWGGGSMYFDGTDDKLTARTSSELAFGTGDFTIEFWLRVNTLRTTYVYDGAGDGGVSARPLIYFISNGTLYYSTNNGGIQIATSSGALQTNTWYHILVSRSGTSTRMFINGTQVGSTATDSTNYLAPITLLGIGGDAALNSNLLDGYISDLRVLKGVALLPTPLQTSQWQDQ